MEPKINLKPIEVLFESYHVFRNNYKLNHKNKSIPQSYGSELYASSIVVMSALLQTYVQDVFEEAFRKKFLHIKTKEDMDKIWKSIGNWGNPSYDNINKLFMRLGIIDIMKEFSWDTNVEEDKKWLILFNKLRNRIAHGEINHQYTVDGEVHKLSQKEMYWWKEFIQNFGDEFHVYVVGKQL